MTQMPKVDALIIGLGAAGGIAAHVLASAGIKVVGLEAGPRLDAGDFVPKMDEIALQHLSLDWRTQVQPRNPNLASRRQFAHTATTDSGHPDGQHGGRHQHSLRHPELAIPRGRFHHPFRHHRQVRRRCASGGIDHGRLADYL